MRVLVVAPYAVARAGLRALLADERDIEIAGEAATADEVRIALEANQIDALVVDYAPPGSESVIELAREQEIPLVVLGEDRGGFQPLAERLPGGWGYLLKDAESGEIAGALRAAASGIAALDRGIARDLAVSNTRLSGENPDSPADLLTLRESQVLQLMASGLPNKTIAATLGISQNTVKFHVAAILSKLGAGSRTEAVTLGARRGLVTL
jgi:DNA-binding NarL/FixJ family response regulator